MSARMDWEVVDAYNTKRVADTIRAAREHHYLTQIQFEELIGRNERFLQDLERAVKAPSHETYMRCVWLLEQEPVQEFKNELPTYEVLRRIQAFAAEVQEGVPA